MANITEEAVWETGIRRIESGEPVSGGEHGTVNISLQGAANRTVWLKKLAEEEKDSCLHSAQNLADVDDVPTARRNLGIHTREEILQAIYPVGAVYISANAANPSTLFEFGTWAQIEGRFLVGAGDGYEAEATGGEAVHTLTAAEMPAHNHEATSTQNGAHIHAATSDNAGAHSHTGTAVSAGAHSHTVSGASAEAGGHSHALSGSTTNAGEHSHTMTIGNFSGGSGRISSYETGTYHTEMSTHAAGAHSHNLSGSAVSGGSHSHSITVTAASNGAHTHSVTNSTGGAHSHAIAVQENGAHAHTINVKSTGSSSPHNNLPPYLAVYIWRRTA